MDQLVLKKLVTQSANDTFTQAAIPTYIEANGKSGWQINAIEAYWVDGISVAAGDWKLNAIVSVQDSVTTFADDEEIGRLSWGMQNTAGVAVAVPLEPLRGMALLTPRITVQPYIYAGVESSGTSQANDVIFRIYYEQVKLSDGEVVKMLLGGA